MKYNPKACNQYAMLPGFLGRHPLAPESTGQGFLACMHELQEMLKEVTGMQGVALSPMAGAHGEFAGVAMIRAYHRARGDLARNEIIVPIAAHGTNPATATMCGCVVREIPVNDEGDVDVDALKAAVGPNTAGIMLTNPSTCGVFERRHQGSGQNRPRRGRPVVLRRRQPQRHSRQGAPGRHGLRCHPHEPAQDFFHAAWRRRSGCGRGRRRRAPAAFHAYSWSASAGMRKTQYYCAASLDGFIAESRRHPRLADEVRGQLRGRGRRSR